MLFIDCFFLYIKHGELNQQRQKLWELNSQFVLIAMQSGTSGMHLIICYPRGPRSGKNHVSKKYKIHSQKDRVGIYAVYVHQPTVKLELIQHNAAHFHPITRTLRGDGVSENIWPSEKHWKMRAIYWLLKLFCAWKAFKAST